MLDGQDDSACSSSSLSGRVEDSNFSIVVTLVRIHMC
jgi:hypothetical protein